MKRRIFDTQFAIFEEKLSSLRKNNELVLFENLKVKNGRNRSNGFLKTGLGFS
jgi:hypothetical protein